MLFIVILALIVVITGLKLAFGLFVGDDEGYRDTPSSEVLAAYRR